MISSIKFLLQAICFEAKSHFSVIVIGKVCPLACLLYTSDAADDMQCVDLGGRRIIKKNRDDV